MANPNSSHFRALDRIWKYLNYYPNLGLYYTIGNKDYKLIAYCDADWGGDTINRKSTSGYITSLGTNIISWNSIQQKSVSLSSCESEYIAISEASKEIIYLSNVYNYINNILSLNIAIPIPPLLTDSQGAKKLAENPEFHKRTKHIDTRYHFIREEIANNKLQLAYIGTKDQLADGFTKGLDNTKHKSFIQKLYLK